MKLKYHTLDDNGNPRPEAISHLIELFDFIPKDSCIRMRYSSEVENSDDCASLEGWVAFAMEQNGIELIEETFKWYSAEISIARILGFYRPYQFRDWAMTNPSLWGNYFAADMYSCNKAYGKERFGPITIKDIKLHWVSVAKRIKTIRSN